LGCKYAAGQMLKQEAHSSGDCGWTINISSILGLVGMPGSSCYSATKRCRPADDQGVLYLIHPSLPFHQRILITPWPSPSSTPKTRSTSTASTQATPRRTCSSPSSRETARTARRRMACWRVCIRGAGWGRPEDIAKAAVFLAGDGASWITGHGLVVDGGYVAQ